MNFTALAAAAALTIAPMPAPMPEPVTEVKAMTATIELVPCPDDEYTGIDCYWDASERGNRVGTDFIFFNGDIYYMSGSAE